MHTRLHQHLFVLFVSVVLLAGCSSTREAQAPTGALRQAIDRILADSIFRPVVTTMKIVSLNTSEVLYERNSQLLMHPASNMKLLTSATALLRLGRDFQFTTRVAYDGVVTDSVLHGSLYIKGMGDPLLTTSALAALAAEVRAGGIRAIDGDIVGDASYFDGERWGVGWMWDDEPALDEAFNSALSVNRNCVEVRVSPGSEAGARPAVTVIPATDYMTVENSAVTGDTLSKNTTEISRNYLERTNTITVKGSMPADSRPKREWISVAGPERYFLTLLKEELLRSDVSVSGALRFGTLPATAREIAIHAQPIDSMVMFMNKVSDNLSAENSLKTLSAEVQGGGGSSAHGVSLVKQSLAGFGIDSASFRMVDGSGVSHYNLVTSDLCVKLLQGMHARKDLFELYHASLPVAGVDGTLSSRMKNTPAQNNLRAKTGTISGVTALAGYVTTADGERLAFSMMMQNFIGTSAPLRRAQDAIGALMASFTRRP